MAIFFRGCIDVKLGFSCDNTKCSFKLELGLGFDNELSLAQSYRAHTRYFLLNMQAQKRFANQSYRAHTRDFLLENMAHKK